VDQKLAHSEEGVCYKTAILLETIFGHEMVLVFPAKDEADDDALADFNTSRLTGTPRGGPACQEDSKNV